jgi:hypothetical protein
MAAGMLSWLPRTVLGTMLTWQAIKHWMVKGFGSRHPLLWFHGQDAFHEIHCTLRHLAHIPLLKSLWLADLWKLQPDKARVLPEHLCLFIRQRPQHLLDDEELVDFRLTRK